MTPDEVSFSPKSNPKLLKILEYLYLGGEVELDNRRVKMANTKDNGVMLYYIAISENAGTGEKKEVVLGLGHANLSWLHRESEEMSDDKYNGIVASIALQRAKTFKGSFK